MCSDVTIVVVTDTGRYGVMTAWHDDYAVVNFESNRRDIGLTERIPHQGYDVAPHNMWDTLRGEVIIFTEGGGHVNTGLKIWKEYEYGSRYDG